MNLIELLQSDKIVTNIVKKDKNDVINELLNACDLSSEDISKEDILQTLFNREEELSTGIGDGIAFPHARILGLNKLHIIIGFSKEGIDFKSMDKKPTHIIVLMLVDRAKPNELLKSRAAIAKLLSNEATRKKLLSLSSSDEIMHLIADAKIKVDYEISAKDIMRPFSYTINIKSSIRDAARELHRRHLDSLPVVDADNKFYGEVSCHDLFSYGLPDFFNNLHVISFVKHMNPFERYFDVDRTMDITEILNKKSKSDLIISPDATLMEIIFEMTVKNKEFLYVLSKDGKLKGILDRYSIVDKILIAR